jgi:uronate dehydrogenase
MTIGNGIGTVTFDHFTMKTILLTGAAGTIGTSLRQHLENDYHFRCLDIKPVADGEDVVIADITDFNAVMSAMHGVDAVIHLAADPHVNQPWETVYTSSISGTYNVFEAARLANVSKIIYASSIHVSWGEIEREQRLAPDKPVRPSSLYGVGKVFGEALARFFTDKYNLSVICLRIGAFIEEPQPENYIYYGHLSRIWCSPRDLAQLVKQSIDSDNLGFQIFYALSNNTGAFCDMSNAEKLICYQPQDDAKRFLRNRARYVCYFLIRVRDFLDKCLRKMC